MAATESPISMAWTRKNTRCPVVTAATALVPSPATILMCMKPTVVNSRLEMIVGHASRQTLWLVGKALRSLEVDKLERPPGASLAESQPPDVCFAAMRWHSLWRKQSVVWSLTIPVACI